MAFARHPKTQAHAFDGYPVGSLIAGRYRVRRRTSGGIGEVYLCIDEPTGLPVAIKTVMEKHRGRPRSYASLVRRLRGEALTWAGLGSHPNVVRCYYLTTDGARPLLVMEWVASPDREDVSLGRIIRKTAPLPLEQTLGFAIGICRGLIHLQQHHPGFVHRDLKPENVLVGHDGVPRVTDFGYSLLRAQPGMPLLPNVSDSSIVGTPHYMAPEQWKSGMVDDRADVYAMGLILYEMATGERAFVAKERAEWRHAHRHEAPRPLPESLPESLRGLIERCLAKLPDERPGSVAVLLHALLEIHVELVGSRPPEPELPTGESVDELVNLGNTYHELGDYERALESYGRALEIAPGNARAIAGRAFVLHSRGELAAALAEYDLALASDPALGWVLVNRANLLRDMGDTAGAIAGYSAALALDSLAGAAAVNRGVLRLAAGDRGGAFADFSLAIESGNAPREALANRAALRAEDGDFAGAAADLEALDETWGLDAEELRRLGLVLAEAGRPRDAVAAFTRALAAGHDDIAGLHRERARAYSINGRPRDALEDLAVAIRFAPADREGYRQRAALHRDEGRFEQAMTDYATLLAQDPTDGEALYEMGIIAGVQGDYEAASALLSEANRFGSTRARGAIKELEARRTLEAPALLGRTRV